MSSKFNAASRAATIAARSAEITYSEIKVPAPSEDFADKFKAASGARTKRTNEWIIDVLPDFRPITLFCIYHANQLIGSLDPRAHAKLSAATLVAYFMNIVYAHFLISDAYIRNPCSHHADEIMSNDTLRNYVYYLLSLPCPDFLLPILRRFVATSTPRRNNVIFYPSATGYNHSYYFGRIIPINAFTLIHDLAAESNSRSDPSHVNYELLTTPLFSYLSGTSYYPVTIGKLTAAIVPDVNPNPTSVTYLNNKVNQIFKALFNPVLLRAYQQKQTFAPINLHAQKFQSENYNPYFMMLSLSHKNVHELQTLFTSIASTMKGVIICKTDLAGVYRDLSGIDILTHGYSAFGLPTWHDTPVTPNTAPAKIKPLDPATFAAAIDFKQVHDQKDFKTLALKPPTCKTDKTHTVILDDDTCLIDTEKDFPTDPSKYVPNSKTYLEFNEEHDLYPVTRVLNPFEEDTDSAWLATLCGLVIESEELEASTVLQPNPLSELGLENAQFLGSAIPLRAIRRGNNFYIRAAGVALNHLTSARSRLNARAPPSATLLRSPSKVYLPYVVTNPRYMYKELMTPGLTRIHSVTLPQLLQTFFGFHVHNDANKDFDDEINAPQNTAFGELLLWSPYIYVSAGYDPKWNADSHADNLLSIYAISNFRTFFGTDPGLIELSSALSAMPVA